MGGFGFFIILGLVILLFFIISWNFLDFRIMR